MIHSPTTNRLRRTMRDLAEQIESEIPKAPAFAFMLAALLMQMREKHGVDYVIEVALMNIGECVRSADQEMKTIEESERDDDAALAAIRKPAP